MRLLDSIKRIWSTSDSKRDWKAVFDEQKNVIEELRSQIFRLSSALDEQRTISQKFQSEMKENFTRMLGEKVDVKDEKKDVQKLQDRLNELQAEVIPRFVAFKDNGKQMKRDFNNVEPDIEGSSSSKVDRINVSLASSDTFSSVDFGNKLYSIVDPPSSGHSDPIKKMKGDSHGSVFSKKFSEPLVADDRGNYALFFDSFSEFDVENFATGCFSNDKFSAPRQSFNEVSGEEGCQKGVVARKRALVASSTQASRYVFSSGHLHFKFNVQDAEVTGDSVSIFNNLYFVLFRSNFAKIAGTSWCVVIGRQDDGLLCAPLLFNREKRDCYVEAEWTLLGSNKKSVERQEACRNLFSTRGYYILQGCFPSWNDLVDPNNCYVDAEGNASLVINFWFKV